MYLNPSIAYLEINWMQFLSYFAIFCVILYFQILKMCLIKEWIDEDKNLDADFFEKRSDQE